MSKEKQIEEMAKYLTHCFMNCAACDKCRAWVYSEQLYDAGYRKQSEIIDEFAEKLKEAPIKCGMPLFGLTTKGEIEDYINVIMLQVRDAIDNIAKEMKGV